MQMFKQVAGVNSITANKHAKINEILNIFG